MKSPPDAADVFASGCKRDKQSGPTRIGEKVQLGEIEFADSDVRVVLSDIFGRGGRRRSSWKCVRVTNRDVVEKMKKLGKVNFLGIGVRQ